MEKLDFAEAAAKANADFHLACADVLARESNALLNGMLAGAAGALAYFVMLADKGAATWLRFGIAAAVIYLFVGAALVLWKCLRVRPIYPPTNEPKNLVPEEFDLDSIRRSELKNRQACIDLNRDRNDLVGMWLNRCRAAAVATPLIFLVGAWAGAC